MKTIIRKCFFKKVNISKKKVIKYISDDVKYSSDHYDDSDADKNKLKWFFFKTKFMHASKKYKSFVTQTRENGHGIFFQKYF